MKKGRNELIELYVRSFNQGDYFAAHEFMEELWAQEGYLPDAETRGLTQLAVALEHFKRGNTTGAQAVLARARKILLSAHPQNKTRKNEYFPGEILHKIFEEIEQGGAIRNGRLAEVRFIQLSLPDSR